MPSRVARTISSDVVLRFDPNMAPRTSVRQCGAARPCSAGTTTTPESVERPAAALLEAASGITFKLSRSHWTAEPVTKIPPSNAYAVRSLKFQPTVVSNPWLESRGLSPMFINRKLPVPKEHFISPGLSKPGQIRQLVGRPARRAGVKVFHFQNRHRRYTRRMA